jgi:hypothetical protein
VRVIKIIFKDVATMTKMPLSFIVETYYVLENVGKTIDESRIAK